MSVNIKKDLDVVVVSYCFLFQEPVVRKEVISPFA